MPARWRWLALLVVLLALLVGAGWFFFLRGESSQGHPQASPPVAPRPALGKTVALSDYTSAVDSASAEVRAAQAASGDAQKQAIRRALDDLERVEGASVSAPATGSPPAEIDNTALINELRRDPPDLRAVAQALDELSGALRGNPSPAYLPGTSDGRQANNTLRDVLKDPVFNYEERLSPLQRFVRWLMRLTGQADPGQMLWRWFISAVAALASGSLAYMASSRLKSRLLRLGFATLAGLAVGAVFLFGTGALDVVSVALAAAGLVVAAVALALVLAGVGRASAPEAKPKSVSELAQVLGMNASEAHKRAADSAGEGDYRSAVRYRCLGVLLTLDEAGMLAFDRSATDREYLYRAPAALQGDLQPLLSRFEDVWYGHTPFTEEEWRDYDTRAARVEASVGSGALPTGRAA